VERGPGAAHPSSMPGDDEPGRKLLRGVIWSMALNTLVPVLLYEFSKHYVSPSEYTALVFATLFPVADSVWGLTRHRQLDPIAAMVIVGIVVDALAISLGGSPKLLLIRESFATGAFGLACFVSLALPRPLMFYFGRHFMAGSDPARRQRFDASWSLPEVRRGNRLITTLWGVVFVGELVLRVVLVFTLPAAVVLVVSPLVLGVLTVLAIVWSLAYAARMRRRVLPLLMASEPRA
jgi:hypothetical protein